MISYNVVKNKPVAGFLLLTATPIETETLLSAMSPLEGVGKLVTIVVDSQEYTIGCVGKYNVIHTQCKSMGALNEGASLSTTQKALDIWPCIKVVIMVGIAFGRTRDGERKQCIGDVLVATTIHHYDSAKVGIDFVENRGRDAYANAELLRCFGSVDSWKGQNLYNEQCSVRMGAMLSGEKLVDNIEFRNQLFEQYPDAIGGEMEGKGLATACDSNRLPWVLVKAICDFADGNKSQEKHERQRCAASNAVEVVARVFSLDSIGKFLSPEYFAFQLAQQVQTKDVLFNLYRTECEPYYLYREIDTIIGETLSTRGLWLYGSSGVGKTTALYRAIIQNRIPYCNVILTSSIGRTTDELFYDIYESLCDFINVDCDNTLTAYYQISKAIVRLLQSCSQEQSLVVVIEEIPIDDGRAEFTDFVNKLCALVIACQDLPIKFLLSSIASPEVMRIQSKVKQNMRFVEMESWTTEDCERLLNIIQDALGIQWDKKYSGRQFAQDMNNNPRQIKTILSTLYKNGHRVINNELVQRAKF